MRKGFTSELAIILVSVLLALSAESWWQGRGDHSRARDYVAAVREDMARLLPELDSAIAHQERQIEAAARTVRLLQSAPSSSDTDRLPPFDWADVPIPLGSLDGLIATGDVNHLDDIGARAAIVRSRSEMTSVTMNLERGSDAMVRALDELIEEGTGLILSREDRNPALPLTIGEARGNVVLTAGYIRYRNTSGIRADLYRQMRGTVEALLDVIGDIEG